MYLKILVCVLVGGQRTTLTTSLSIVKNALYEVDVKLLPYSLGITMWTSLVHMV
jgi:hypothetical protein